MADPPLWFDKKVLLFTVIFSLMAQFSEPRAICPSPLIEAEEGEDVSLPCYLDPRVNLSAYTVDWKTELNGVVYSFRYKREDHRSQMETYRGRATIHREDLNRGNATLLLQSAQLSDSGVFKCNMPKLKTSCFVRLNVSKAQQRTAETRDGRNSTVEEAEGGGPAAGTTTVPYAAISSISLFCSVVAALFCSAFNRNRMEKRPEVRNGDAMRRRGTP